MSWTVGAFRIEWRVIESRGIEFGNFKIGYIWGRYKIFWQCITFGADIRSPGSVFQLGQI